MKNRGTYSKTYITYGAILGLLMILLQIIHYKAMVRELQIELFGAGVGIVFLGIGIWLGISIFQKKKHPDQYHSSQLGLSNREIEVLELLSQGYTNQEIADQLYVSLNTTKTHLSNIYSKLNVKRRTQAIQKARELSISSQPKE